MSYRLLTQLARQAAKKSFPKAAQESKKLLQRFVTAKKAKELTIQTGKKIGQMSSAVRKKAATYKDKNDVTKILYKKHFYKNRYIKRCFKTDGRYKKEKTKKKKTFWR